MTATQTSGVVTPEAVLLEFHPAGLATRAAAKLIDVVLQFFLLLLVSMLGALVAMSGETAGRIFLVLGAFFVLLFAPALCEAFRNGRTPGKAFMGLRVLTVEGGPVNFRHAIVRNVIQLIEVPLGLAVVVALANRRSQRIGDFAAGTFVISERGLEQRIVPIGFYPPPGCEAYCHALDVSRLDPEQFLLVRNFLLRVHEFDAEARYALAVRLADPLRAMCSPAPPPGMQPELFLICVCSAYQIRHGGLPPLPQAYQHQGGYPTRPPTAPPGAGYPVGAGTAGWVT